MKNKKLKNEIKPKSKKVVEDIDDYQFSEETLKKLKELREIMEFIKTEMESK